MYAPALVLVVRGTVCAQLEAFGGGKDPTVLPAAMPVTGEEPLFFLVGMALAGPAQKQVLHQVVTVAQDGCWNAFCVVGRPSSNDQIEFTNTLCLRGCAQLGQELTDGSHMPVDRLLTGSDADLESRQPATPTLAYRVVANGEA